MTKRNISIGAAALAILLLAACGSGGIGDILNGGGNSSPNGTYSNDITGTVDYVDTNSRSIVLTNVSGYNGSMLSSGGNNGNSVRVYYDNNTTVTYQGQGYSPADLERGDQVSARLAQSGNNLVATSMQVTYNARTSNTSGNNPYPSSGSTYPSNTYPSNGNYSTLRGTVRYIDTSRRTIELENTNWIRGYQNNNSGAVITVQYATNAGINVNGQMQAISGLERGDVVDVDVSNTGGSMLYADRLTLVRDVNSR